MHRITKLRPTMDRIGALVAAVKRIAEVAGPADDWKGNSYKGDFIVVGREIAVLEKELALLANEWTLALWED